MLSQFVHSTEYIDELVMMRVKDKGDLYVQQAERDRGGSVKEWDVIGFILDTPQRSPNAFVMRPSREAGPRRVKDGNLVERYDIGGCFPARDCGAICSACAGAFWGAFGGSQDIFPADADNNCHGSECDASTQEEALEYCPNADLNVDGYCQ